VRKNKLELDTNFNTAFATGPARPHAVVVR
jgi:hypothetical protein